MSDIPRFIPLDDISHDNGTFRNCVYSSCLNTGRIDATSIFINGAPIGGSIALPDLTDVTLGALSNGEVLTYNGGSGMWVNSPPASSVTQLDDLSDVTLGALSNGEVLTYNAGVWANQALPNQSISVLTDTTIGVLSSGEVLTWTGATWENQALQLDDLSDVTLAAPSLGQVLTYNGSLWVNQALPAGVSQLDDLSDVTLGALSNGEVLTYNAGVWANQALSAGVTSLNDLSDASVSGVTGDALTVEVGAPAAVSTNNVLLGTELGVTGTRATSVGALSLASIGTAVTDSSVFGALLLDSADQLTASVSMGSVNYNEITGTVFDSISIGSFIGYNLAAGSVVNSTIAIGVGSLRPLVATQHNLFGNIAIGNQILSKLTNNVACNQNVIIGQQALRDIDGAVSGANQNVVVGHLSCELHTGPMIKNTVVGFQTRPDAAIATFCQNRTVIGAEAVGTFDNEITIKAGTTNFQVRNSGSLDGEVLRYNSALGAYFAIHLSVDDLLEGRYASGTDTFMINGGGASLPVLADRATILGSNSFRSNFANVDDVTAVGASMTTNLNIASNTGGSTLIGTNIYNTSNGAIVHTLTDNLIAGNDVLTALAGTAATVTQNVLLGRQVLTAWNAAGASGAATNNVIIGHTACDNHISDVTSCVVIGQNANLSGVNEDCTSRTIIGQGAVGRLDEQILVKAGNTVVQVDPSAADNGVGYIVIGSDSADNALGGVIDSSVLIGNKIMTTINPTNPHGNNVFIGHGILDVFVATNTAAQNRINTCTFIGNNVMGGKTDGNLNDMTAIGYNCLSSVTGNTANLFFQTTAVGGYCKASSSIASTFGTAVGVEAGLGLHGVAIGRSANFGAGHRGTFVGFEAGVGWNSAPADDTGPTGLGYRALRNNSTSLHAVAVGNNALRNATLCTGTTAVGSRALATIAAASSIQNTVMGAFAMESTVNAATNNVVMGYQAGALLASAAASSTLDNVLIGHGAAPLFDNANSATFTDNVIMGKNALAIHAAGASNNVTNNVLIGRGVADAHTNVITNCVVIGKDADPGNPATACTGRTVIGESAVGLVDNEITIVAGSTTFNVLGTGTVNQVLQHDGTRYVPVNTSALAVSLALNDLTDATTAGIVNQGLWLDGTNDSVLIGDSQGFTNMGTASVADSTIVTTTAGHTGTISRCVLIGENGDLDATAAANVADRTVIGNAAVGTLDNQITLRGGTSIVQHNGSGTLETEVSSASFNVGMGLNVPAMGTHCVYLGPNVGGGGGFGGVVVIGSGAVTSGSDSVLVGRLATGSANSVAVGNSATAATGGVAVGIAASVSGAAGVAIGVGPNAAIDSIAIGDSATAAAGSVVIGDNASSSTNGVAIGGTASVTANGAVSIGKNSSASLDSIAIGDTASAAAFSVAIGDNATAVASSIAIGRGATTALADTIVMQAGTSTFSFTGTGAGQEVMRSDGSGRFSPWGVLNSGVSSPNFTNLGGVVGGPTLDSESFIRAGNICHVTGGLSIVQNASFVQFTLTIPLPRTVGFPTSDFCGCVSVLEPTLTNYTNIGSVIQFVSGSQTVAVTIQGVYVFSTTLRVGYSYQYEVV